MRYIDTGSRDPEQALGSWLRLVLDATVVEFRCQTGFFGAKALGLLTPIFERFSEADLPLHFVVGSNDGTTPRADVETLLALSGPSRSNRKIGIVSFESGYFHPKTLHITRADGSAAAYVGSANLTESGVASLHVEAGVLVDTREGDDLATINGIAAAIDWWFAKPRPGLTAVNGSQDLDALVADGILDVPVAPRPLRPPPKIKTKSKRRGHTLKRLINLPRFPSGAPIVIAAPVLSAAPAAAAEWGKRLTRSDAQRKPSGNQRGSITLVRAGFPIDAQKYFRHDFFRAASWKVETTSTGEIREVALVPIDATILGKKLGVRQVMVTHAPNREAGQANYTSLLHLHPTLTPYFAKTNLTGKWLHIQRLTDGRYRFTIQDAPP
jgi:hypothetical protein